jgi:hypothetical protein
VSSRPQFRPIPAPPPVDDATLEQIADKLGVPKLVTPVPDPPMADQIPAVDKPRAEPGPSPTARTAKRTHAQKKRPPVEMMKFSAQIPVYVSQAINQRAAADRCTVRHLLLLGMRAIGIPVEDADLVPDGRRQPPRSRS